MDENRIERHTSILIGCGVLSILLSLVRFTVLKGANVESTESFGFLFFGVGYLLLGLSRKTSPNADRHKLFSNLATVALIVGTAIIGYYTFGSLK